RSTLFPYTPLCRSFRGLLVFFNRTRFGASGETLALLYRLKEGDCTQGTRKSVREISLRITCDILKPQYGFRQSHGIGMHRYHFFTNRYEYEYFYLCTCRYRVPIPILLRFGLQKSAINLEADFILSSADYVKPIVQN